MSLLARLSGTIRHFTPTPTFLSVFPTTPLATLSQQRFYRRHTYETLSHPHGTGRSVQTTGDRATQAYFRLRDVVQESKLREIVRAQDRFERSTDKRRRKRKEKEWKAYMRVVKKRVAVAFDLKNRTTTAKRLYDDI
ncbi:hypothetical protein DFJ77DRAFT_506819 [Powellomyces hirtus]|nr:hypothetical protein DFJ77DRAFT_506819 [Powellomyces hirtus]